MSALRALSPRADQKRHPHPRCSLFLKTCRRKEGWPIPIIHLSTLLLIVFGFEGKKGRERAVRTAGDTPPPFLSERAPFWVVSWCSWAQTCLACARARVDIVDDIVVRCWGLFLTGVGIFGFWRVWELERKTGCA